MRRAAGPCFAGKMPAKEAAARWWQQAPVMKPEDEALLLRAAEHGRLDSLQQLLNERELDAKSEP